MMNVAFRRVAPALGAAFLIACSPDDGEPSQPIPTPDAGVAHGANKGLGEACAIPSECESAQCFVGGQSSYCSRKCGSANAAAVCVPPAFNGTCNKQGFCRKP